VFGFAIFYFDKNLLKNLGYLFGFGCTGVTDLFTNSVIFDNILLLAAALFFAVPVIPTLWNRLKERGMLPYTAERILKTLVLIAFITLASVRLVGNSYSAFLYFRF
jgi:hypothetical protein